MQVNTTMLSQFLRWKWHCPL